MMHRKRFKLYFLFLIHCEYINVRAIALQRTLMFSFLSMYQNTAAYMIFLQCKQLCR